MSLCANQIICATAPACIENLVIGTIENLNTNLRVMLFNGTTGRKTILPATSDGAGVVTMPLDDCRLISNHAYRLTVSLDSGDITDRIEVTVDSQTGNELHVIFGDILDADSAQVTAETYTLIVAN